MISSVNGSSNSGDKKPGNNARARRQYGQTREYLIGNGSCAIMLIKKDIGKWEGTEEEEKTVHMVKNKRTPWPDIKKPSVRYFVRRYLRPNSGTVSMDAASRYVQCE